MSNDNEVELSPGFFDLNNPMNNDDDDELNDIIPDKIDIENNDTKNVVVEFVTLMIFNTTTATGKPCGCNGGWTRTSTY